MTKTAMPTESLATADPVARFSRSGGHAVADYFARRVPMPVWLVYALALAAFGIGVLCG